MTLDVWLLIAGCVVGRGTVLIKGVGPVMLGGRDLPPVASRVIASMAPALLAALVVTSVFADGQRYHLGAETVGVLAGGVLLWRGRSVVLAVLVAGAGARSASAPCCDVSGRHRWFARRRRAGLACAVPGA